MPTLTQNAPGTFCWFELATNDQNASRSFYTQLFDYETTESPLPKGGTYTMLKLGGRDAAAVFTMDAGNYPSDTPPHWMAYIAVTDADATAAKVTASGGKVVMGAFDVMEHGRMAVCMDPLGAAFCVWQAKSHAGVGVVGEPGAFGWCQLNVPSSRRADAQKFYTSVFGWTFREDPMPMGDVYTTWLTSDCPIGGMMPMPAFLNAPAHWLVYLASADVDASTAKAKSLGGGTMVPPTDIPGVGRFSVVNDPQGAIFAIVKFIKPMA